MKILFASFSPLLFDVATPEFAPLGGAESCVSYLAAELGKSHDVVLLANTTHQETVRRVRHLQLTEANVNEFLPAQGFDAVVILNAALAGPRLRTLSPKSRFVLWNHHAPDQSAIQSLERAEVRRAFDLIVYVSDWQKVTTEARFENLPRSHVIGNGLTPAFERMFTDASALLQVKQWRATYTSTPFRGLELLLDVYGRLSDPPILDVFSSMQVYRGDDAPFQSMYARARSLPSVRYYGSVSQTRLASAMRTISFFCYPCVFPETFCIAALEAMAAGAQIVSTDLGALASTTMGFARLMPMSSTTRDEFIDHFEHLYIEALREFQTDRVQWAERMFAQSEMVNGSATWRHRAASWIRILSDITGAGVC